MEVDQGGTPRRTVRQIVDSAGEPYKAVATENIWVGHANGAFSLPTGGNTVTPFFSGKEYFAALIKAIDGAQQEVYIAGWQVNWDAQMAPGVRLYDVVLRNAKRGVKFHVMPWDDAAPMQTYDDQTKAVLESINKICKAKKVVVQLASSPGDKAASFFSHHQKQVVVDRKVAFMGGIDLAYGRYDDDTFDLRANADGRKAMNRYNGCVVPMGKLSEAEVCDPDLLSGGLDLLSGNVSKTLAAIASGAHQAPYKSDSPVNPENPGIELVALDPARQPRMPWQDMHVRIMGPAVADLTRNFVVRWNTLDKNLKLSPAPVAEKAKGECIVQVLRSASATMRAKEPPHNEIKGSSGVQDDILRAMRLLIDKAQHYIYLENQFFVSSFGTQNCRSELDGPGQMVWKKDSGMKPSRLMSGDSTALPNNDICESLGKRIGRAILDHSRPPFHVYITLPVWSEGLLNSASTVTQIHWTMQSLVFGSNSLLNRVRRYLLARKLSDAGDKNWRRVLDSKNKEYEKISLSACDEYVTLLNLRNWAKLGDRYVTEQIYVHTKMTIVDDRFALIGSANINDRSLLGGRDSELAVLIMDNATQKKDLCGDGKMRSVRTFAHELRKGVWKKIFGISGGVRPATELAQAIEHPGSPKSWAAIQKVARDNARKYEAAFHFIPRNRYWEADANVPSDQSASLWPIWNKEDIVQKGVMPFDSHFWAAPRHSAPGVGGLASIKGFITALPIEWTKGEKNDMGYHTALVMKNDAVVPSSVNQVDDSSLASIDPISSEEEGLHG